MNTSFLQTGADGLFVRSTLYSPLYRHLAMLPATVEMPDTACLNALAERADLRTGQGQPVRFRPPARDRLGYEERIWRTGIVETRPDNWHDFFNALVWLAFPRAKAALSSQHAKALKLGQVEEPGPVPRCRRRDALTHFDECGALVVSSDIELLQLLHDFCWRRLFCDLRTRVQEEMRCIIFGHATYERLLSPYPAITVKALLMPVETDWLALPAIDAIADLDARLATDFASGIPADARSLSPLPVLGWPGACTENNNLDYYDNEAVFRPGRTFQTRQTEEVL